MPHPRESWNCIAVATSSGDMVSCRARTGACQSQDRIDAYCAQQGAFADIFEPLTNNICNCLSSRKSLRTDCCGGISESAMPVAMKHGSSAASCGKQSAGCSKACAAKAARNLSPLADQVQRARELPEPAPGDGFQREPAAWPES